MTELYHILHKQRIRIDALIKRNEATILIYCARVMYVIIHDK